MATPKGTLRRFMEDQLRQNGGMTTSQLTYAAVTAHVVPTSEALRVNASRRARHRRNGGREVDKPTIMRVRAGVHDLISQRLYAGLRSGTFVRDDDGLWRMP